MANQTTPTRFSNYEGSEDKAIELLKSGLSPQKTANALNEEYGTPSTYFTKSVVKKAADRHKVKTGNKSGPPKQSYQERAEKHDINQLLAKKSLYDCIGEAFISAVKRLPAPTSVPVYKGSPKIDEEELCFVFSDSQIGGLINPKETGGLGAYSTDIFDERMEYLKGSLAKIFEIHKHTPYRRINLFFLGDIIEGATIFKGQLRSIDMNVVNQVMKSVNAISDFVAWVSTIFPEVACYCVVGNHGRIGQFGELSPMDNLDYLVYKWTEERLGNHQNVTVNVADTWWMAVERMSTRFVLVHGDDVRAWMNIPFYGAERSEMRMQKLLNIAFQYYVIGHHHTKADFGNIIMNGCWPGGSEFSLKRMQVGGLPTQKLFSIHPTFGVTWKRDILLVDPRTIQPTRIYK